MGGPKNYTSPGSQYTYMWDRSTNSWREPTVVTTPHFSYLRASYTKTVPTMTRRGYVFDTPATYGLTTMRGAYGTRLTLKWDRSNQTWVPEQYVIVANYNAPMPTFGSIMSRDRVTQEALAQLDSAGSSTNMEMLTKDLVDAMQLSNEYFSRLLQAAPAIRKGKFKEAWKQFNKRKGQLRSTRKSISDHWLAFQWGVKPSLEACINAYYLATDDQSGRSFTIRTAFKSVGYATRQIFVNDRATNVPCYGQHSRACYVTRRFVEMSYREFAHLWDNPIVPAWDAVPWSFLVDWFVPIGSYLSQFGYYKSSSKVIGSNANVEIKTYGGNLTQVSKTYGWIEESFSPQTVYSFNRSVSNRIHASYTVADIVEKSKFGVSRGQLLSAAALSNQKLGRR